MKAERKDGREGAEGRKMKGDEGRKMKVGRLRKMKEQGHTGRKEGRIVYMKTRVLRQKQSY